MRATLVNLALAVEVVFPLLTAALLAAAAVGARR